MRRAGFWIRALAMAIDVVIAVALGTLASEAAYYKMYDLGRPQLAQYSFDIVGYAVALAYTSSEVWMRRSPGKLLLGLAIVRRDGSPADRWGLMLRWCTKWYGYLIMFVAVIGLRPFAGESLGGYMSTAILVGCLPALDEDKRTWHDEWSGTAVIRRRLFRRPPAAAPLPC